jgi:RNA polymerase sigma-70 factor, ECF subfamily
VTRNGEGAVSTCMVPSDALIVERVRDGDVDAFRFLVTRHYGGLLRYAMRMLGNTADAEEAVQDTFVRAYRSLARYDSSRPVDSWLWGILVNRCRTTGAQRSRRERLQDDASAAVADGDVPFVGSTGRHHEPRPELQRALEQLPEAHREALLLKYLDERTYEEMNAVTGVSVSALKMRVKRAREQLEALLREVYDE